MDADVQILTHRVTALEDTMGSVMGEIRDGIREIAVNTGKLAVLEERHAETRDGLTRAFDEIKRLQNQKCDMTTCARRSKATGASLEEKAGTNLETSASATSKPSCPASKRCGHGSSPWPAS